MISIIIPFYNEEKSIPILLKELFKILKKIKEKFEIVLVDDGSNDNFQSSIKNFRKRKEIKLISHRKRLGKGEALRTGINNSRGEIIVFMDGDLQDDPADLRKFLNKIKEGYDFVNGLRKKRKTPLLFKFYSRLAFYFLRIFLNSPFEDINCGYKTFRKTVLKDFNFYANNFRFFPLAVYYQGYKTTEVDVNNRERKFSQPKFKKSKIFIGIFDTLTAYFLYKFSEKPLHFFGIIGGVFFLTGFLISLYLTIMRLFFNILLYRRPLLYLGTLLIIVGIQIMMTGFIGELIVFLNKKNK